MPKINMLPARAGMIRLITQILTDVRPIPRSLRLNNPINFKLTCPRRPRSVNKAMVGMTAITKKETDDYIVSVSGVIQKAKVVINV